MSDSLNQGAGDLYEAYLVGTDRRGKVYPRMHLFSVACVQVMLAEYLRKYPTVIHVNMDIAIPDQQYLRTLKDV